MVAGEITGAAEHFRTALIIHQRPAAAGPASQPQLIQAAKQPKSGTQLRRPNSGARRCADALASDADARCGPSLEAYSRTKLIATTGRMKINSSSAQAGSDMSGCSGRRSWGWRMRGGLVGSGGGPCRRRGCSWGGGRGVRAAAARRRTWLRPLEVPEHAIAQHGGEVVHSRRGRRSRRRPAGALPVVGPRPAAGEVAVPIRLMAARRRDRHQRGMPGSRTVRPSAWTPSGACHPLDAELADLA